MKKMIVKSTPFGDVVIIWTTTGQGPTIIRVLLSKPLLSAQSRVSELYPDAQTASCTEIDAVASGIWRLLQGDPVEFSLDIAALSLCGDFQQRVLRAEHAIPRGSVSTYRLIGMHLGKPKGARAVGNALANNPFPLIVPCHRAIRSDRHLGGYQGGLEMKRTLLAKEGIAFDRAGRVKCSRFHYEDQGQTRLFL